MITHRGLFSAIALVCMLTSSKEQAAQIAELNAEGWFIIYTGDMSAGEGELTIYKPVYFEVKWV